MYDSLYMRIRLSTSSFELSTLLGLYLISALFLAFVLSLSCLAQKSEGEFSGNEGADRKEGIAASSSGKGLVNAIERGERTDLALPIQGQGQVQVNGQLKLMPQEAQLDQPDDLKSPMGLPAQSQQAAVRSQSLRTHEFKLQGQVIEQELAIEWDQWHNRFAKAVRNGMFRSMFDAINMPPGAITWYHCEVDAQRKLKNVRISRSSGNFWYDKAVIDAVRNLDGNEILAFPRGSKRLEVSTDIGIKLGGPRTGDINFGDVERRQLSPEEAEAEQNAEEKAAGAESPAPNRKKGRR